MRINRHNGLPEPAASPGPSDQSPEHPDRTTAATAARRRWRLPRLRNRENVQRATESGIGGDQTQSASDQNAEVQAAPGQVMADAMQLAIAVLTAGLDSPELESWVADTLTPAGVEGLGDLIAGLHMTSVALLTELHRATGEPLTAILQRLAILAERRRGTPFAG